MRISNWAALGLPATLLVIVMALGGITGKSVVMSTSTIAPIFTPGLSSLSMITAENADQLTELINIKYAGTAGLAWSPDGQALAIADAEGISLYALSTLTVSHRLGQASEPVRNVVFSPNGTLLAYTTSSRNTDIVLWDLSTQKQWYTLTASDSITRLAFSPDSATVAAGEGDDLNGVPGAIEFWEVRTGKRQSVLASFDQMVTSLAFSPDGSLLASSSKDRVIRLWNVKTNTERFTLRGHTDLLGNVAFSPDGSILAFTDVNEDLNGIIRLQDVENNVELLDLQTHDGELTGLAFNPNGTVLASGGYDGRLRLWNVALHTQIIALDGYAHSAVFVAFSPRGNILASSGGEGVIKLWGIKD